MKITSKLNTEQTIKSLLPELDQKIQTNLTSLQIINPTYSQEQLFTLKSERKHLVLRSSQHSGRTLGFLVLQINDLLQKTQQQCHEEEQNKVQTISAYICASKDLVQKTSEMAQKLLQNDKRVQILSLQNFEEGQLQLFPNKSYFLISTISNFLRFAKYTKFEIERYANFTFDDIDFMLSFQYKNDLENFRFFFQTHLPNIQVYWGLQDEINDDFKEFKKTFLTKSAIIDIEEEQGQEEDIQNEGNNWEKIQQYYSVGDVVGQYILLYTLFKLNLLQGKSLIICKNLNEVYKIHLFLERIGVEEFQSYNHENPVNLRYYLVSIFNTGLIKTLIATPQVFNDLEKDFDDKKRITKCLKGIKNMVIFDFFEYGSEFYQQVYTKFSANQGNVFLSIINNEKNLEFLMQIIEEQKQLYQKSNFKEFPLKKHEMEAFRYRVNNVHEGITKKQLDNFKMLDFKKKLLKSPDMKDYYEKNPQEKQILIESIQKLTNQIKKNEVRCEGECPEYLLPQFLKDKVSSTQEKIKKILVYQPKNNNLSKKVRLNKYVYINESKENDDETDPSRLKVISRRKQWKLRHGFKLKKINKRLEKKGIFQS